MEMDKLVSVVKPQRQRVSEVVCNEIMEMIISKMKAGDRLPTEFKLSSTYGVSRSTIRESLQMLESNGVVERGGGGTYVSSAPKECLVEPLSLMIHMKFAELSDIFQMRRILEVEAVKLAVANASKEDLRNLENIFWMMQKPDLKPDEFVELDKQFHYAIAEATGNTVLSHFIKDINTVISKFVDKLCIARSEARSIAIPLHRKTLNGMLAKNVDLALEGITEHLTDSEEAANKEYSLHPKLKIYSATKKGK
jgi:GntR family transcriptional regulator, transcriptional repressor for pyruvate dehydrogenase complex